MIKLLGLLLFGMGSPSFTFKLVAIFYFTIMEFSLYLIRLTRLDFIYSSKEHQSFCAQFFCKIKTYKHLLFLVKL
ncbi:hypothetical protein A7310_14905 [Bacillus velezensis]|nr:hypothetical protein A7310_14905 [Bacillus velezensis]